MRGFLRLLLGIIAIIVASLLFLYVQFYLLGTINGVIAFFVLIVYMHLQKHDGT